MKNKIVLWGTDAADERILVALELKIDDNKVMVYTFPEKVATDDFYQQMMDQWRNNSGEVSFPEEHQSMVRELSISEGLLPDEIKVERTDLIQRAQTEWHFVVLSSKLSHAYKSELQDLEDRLSALKDYDKELWANLKQFWSKVQLQMQDRTLLREHADEIRNRTNKAFDQLKALRSKMDDEFRKNSKDNVERFEALLNDVEARIKENKHVTKIFDELKGLQKELRDVAFTRDHRNKLWQRIDSAFKEVKEKRFGNRGDSGNSPLQRITSRYNGLMNAIDKMEHSIKRDDDDLEFQHRKIDRTDGQLEAQIRKAKIQMIEQRVNSKREKLKEMLATKGELEAKIEKEKDRQAKREAQAQKEAARQEAQAKAKEKIAEDIKRQQENLSADDANLSSAAEAINKQKSQGKAKSKKKASPEADSTTTKEEQTADAAPQESLLGAISTTLSESLEDVMDTVKAVAEVVGQQIEDKVEEIKQDFNETAKSEEE